MNTTLNPIQKRERAAAIGAIADRMAFGIEFTAGDTIAFTCRFGDEGSGSCTLFNAYPIDPLMIAEAEALLAR